VIRICFRYDDTRLFARLVCALRGGDSAHVEVAHRWIGDMHDCVSSSWVDDGVRPKLIQMHQDRWRVYEVPGNPEDVRQYLKEHEGEKYDWLSFFGYGLLRRLSGSSRRKTCVEVAADLMWLRSPHRWDLYDLESVCLRLTKAGLGRQVR
jgi:hypothetical protein